MPGQDKISDTVTKTGEAAAKGADAAKDVARSTGSAVHNALLAGIGAVALGVDRLEALGERFVERGRAVEAEGWGIASARKRADATATRLREATSDTAASLRSASAEQREAMLRQMGVASAEELRAIRERLDALAGAAPSVDAAMEEDADDR